MPMPARRRTRSSPPICAPGTACPPMACRRWIVAKPLSDVVKAFLASLLDTGYAPSEIRAAMRECGFMSERDYPEVPEVEVLLDGRPLPREQWERHAVHRSDLLDAKSGTRAVQYGCNGTVTIQRRHASGVREVDGQSREQSNPAAP